MQRVAKATYGPTHGRRARAKLVLQNLWDGAGGAGSRSKRARDGGQDQCALRGSEAADQAHQPTLNVDLVGAEDPRLVIGVGGLQRD
jgi:hypothetical protein